MKKMLHRLLSYIQGAVVLFFLFITYDLVSFLVDSSSYPIPSTELGWAYESPFNYTLFGIFSSLFLVVVFFGLNLLRIKYLVQEA
jgi:hypothetical protein